MSIAAFGLRPNAWMYGRYEGLLRQAPSPTQDRSGRPDNGVAKFSPKSIKIGILEIQSMCF